MKVIACVYQQKFTGTKRCYQCSKRAEMKMISFGPTSTKKKRMQVVENQKKGSFKPSHISFFCMECCAVGMVSYFGVDGLLMLVQILDSDLPVAAMVVDINSSDISGKASLQFFEDIPIEEIGRVVLKGA